MNPSDEKTAWLQLRLLPDMTRARFYALIDHFQSPILVFGASAQEIASLRGFDDDFARKVLEAPRSVETGREVELMERHGVRLVSIEDDEYPENLRTSSFPPPVLYVRGRLETRDRYAVGIVGSRNSTQYGRATTQLFATRLAAVGLSVISGFARGIDSTAHASAISVKGRTVAVLGNGHAVCYPAENRKLGEQIAETGALVSEYPMETAPERYNFPERNHVIAAMSLGVVVVEAAEKSGALITANQAVDENRFLFAVPGDINRQNSRGTNALIQQGARLVQRPDEILEEMKGQLKGFLREDAAASATTPANQEGGATVHASLSADEQAILDLIRHEPQYFDVIASKLDPEKISVQRLSAILLGLELKQVVKQMPGRLYAALDS